MKLILDYTNWIAENMMQRHHKKLSELDINRKFSKDQFTGDKYETELFPMFRRLKPRIEALGRKPNIEEWFIMMQNSDNQFYSMVQAGVLGQPDVRELWRDLTGRRASKMHKYNLAEEKVNELFDTLDSAYPWQIVESEPEEVVYKFKAGDLNYHVTFFEPEEGLFERMYGPIEYGETDDKFKTNKFNYPKILITVTAITLDFLDKNQKWHEVLIHPIGESRYKTVLNILDKWLPDKYLMNAQDGVITIERKLAYN